MDGMVKKLTKFKNLIGKFQCIANQKRIEFVLVFYSKKFTKIQKKMFFGKF